MNWETVRKQIQASGNLEEDTYILGIDLGTTNSVVSYWNSRMKRPEPIDASNGFGKIPLPSVVQYRKDEGCDEEWVVGEEALQTVKLYPEATIRSIKRKMGSKEQVSLGGKSYYPEEISAIILRELIGQVSAMNPKMALAGVVVSVPYDFDDAAKKATIKACQMAGLSDSLIGLIEEPKAAALAYSFRHDLAIDEKVLVFDFGGGTLDITAFHVEEKDEQAIHMKVICEGGEAYHGGDNVDNLLYQQLLKVLEEKTGLNREQITKEGAAELAIRSTEAKERLSGVMQHRIPFTFCIPPFVQAFSRPMLEDLLQPMIHKTKQLVLEALKSGYDGPIGPDEITRVLLEGGASKMPWVKAMLEEIFGDQDKIYVSEQPALDISLGATYYGAMKLGLLDHKDIHTLDRRVTFETPVPHDIGFEVAYQDDLKFYPMIRRGTPYPLARKTMVFTLSGDNEEDMTTLNMRILERLKSNDRVKECQLVGEVNVEGLPKRPKGKTRIQVTLSIDERAGTVEGQVKDLGYGHDYEASGFEENFSPERNSRTIVHGGRLTQ